MHSKGHVNAKRFGPPTIRIELLPPVDDVSLTGPSGFGMVKGDILKRLKTTASGHLHASWNTARLCTDLLGIELDWTDPTQIPVRLRGRTTIYKI